MASQKLINSLLESAQQQTSCNNQVGSDSIISFKPANKFKSVSQLKKLTQWKQDFQEGKAVVQNETTSCETQKQEIEEQIVYKAKASKYMASEGINKRSIKRNQRVNLIMQDNNIEIDVQCRTDHPCGHISQMPFEMYMIIVQYCPAQESFNMLRINKETRSFVLAAKIIILKQLFHKETSLSKTSLQDIKIQKYFKIIENAGSNDVFVFYEILVWAIREGMINFIQKQIDKTFPQIIRDATKSQRISDRLLAFFTPQVSEIIKTQILPKVIDEETNQLNQEKVDQIFEYLLNKRRKYDSNTLVHLAVLAEKEDILEYFIGNQERWRYDKRTKNKDGHAIVHMAVKQANEKIFNIIAKFQPHLVIPVGNQFNGPTSVNISMYEDTITLAAQQGLTDIVRRLINSGTCNIHTLNIKKAMIYACEKNYFDIVKLFISFGFELNNISINKKSPLYAASENGHIELATYLIQRFEVDPNLQCEDSNKTALFIACEKGFSQIATELVRRPDIDVNKMTSGKKTALYVAIEKLHIECVRQVLKKCKQEDLYQQTSFGTTPLFAAQRKGNKEIIKLMMGIGKQANPDYEQNIPTLPQAGSGDIFIMNEIPRFLQDVKTFSELNPSEFNGGLPFKCNPNVKSRYMEILNKKIVKEEEKKEEKPKQPQRSLSIQNQLPRIRPQTAKLTQQKSMQRDMTLDEEFKEEEIKEEVTKTPIKRTETIQRQPLKLKYDISKKELTNSKGEKFPAATVQIISPQNSKENLVNQALSKVKSRLFDYLSKDKTQEEQQQLLKDAQQAVAVQKPPSLKRLAELSKPRHVKPLETKECFIRQQSLNMIVYKDPTYLKNNLVIDNEIKESQDENQDKNVAKQQQLQNPTQKQSLKQPQRSSTQHNQELRNKSNSKQRPSDPLIKSTKTLQKLFTIKSKKPKKNMMLPSSKIQNDNKDIEEFIDKETKSNTNREEEEQEIDNDDNDNDEDQTESNMDMSVNQTFQDSQKAYKNVQDKFLQIYGKFYKSSGEIVKKQENDLWDTYLNKESNGKDGEQSQEEEDDIESKSDDGMFERDIIVQGDQGFAEDAKYEEQKLTEIEKIKSIIELPSKNASTFVALKYQNELDEHSERNEKITVVDMVQDFQDKEYSNNQFEESPIQSSKKEIPKLLHSQLLQNLTPSPQLIKSTRDSIRQHLQQSARDFEIESDVLSSFNFHHDDDDFQLKQLPYNQEQQQLDESRMMSEASYYQHQDFNEDDIIVVDHL